MPVGFTPDILSAVPAVDVDRRLFLWVGMGGWCLVLGDWCAGLKLLCLDFGEDLGIVKL